MKTSTRVKMALIAAAIASTQAHAEQLRIGRANEPSAIDPQFAQTSNNQMTADNVFDTLLRADEHLQMHPSLATSWANVDQLTWEISLREGVTFHDGSSFTADDVIFSLERTDKVPNSPAPFSDAVNSIAKLEKLGDHKIRVTTKVPNPALMEQIGRVFILSKAAAANASLADFNSGKAAIGTGPYQFVSWKPAESLRLKAYVGYWGDKPDFEDVELRFIPNDAARTAALLSGSVDLIDSVSPTDVERLSSQKGVKVYPIVSGRLIYLALNMRGDVAPGTSDLSGARLASNPFRDVRVRQAISAMIDRRLLVERILNGAGLPSAQIVPAELGGHVAGLDPTPAEKDRAKALLKDAGFPDGFGITIHSSNNRFPRDGDIGQALGQMLARGGLTVKGVQTQPYNVYAASASKGEYGAFVFSIGASTPNSETNLRSLLHSYDADAGTGSLNRMRYDNADFDRKLEAAMAEFDYEKRMAGLVDATRVAVDDQAIIPLYFQKVYWASRDGVSFTPNLAERTLAKYARVAPKGEN